jgi:hypothetical protein
MATVIDREALPFMSWTLYDYPEVPWQVAGRAPWKRNPQRQFGLLDVEGRIKPSGKAYSEFLQK